MWSDLSSHVVWSDSRMPEIRTSKQGREDHSVTLLHVSDMQFGRNHRFGRLGLPGADADFDTLLRRLTDDLASLRDGEHQLQPDLLVVSGDLAEWGKKSEFDDASEFLERLTEFLGLSRRGVG